MKKYFAIILLLLLLIPACDNFDGTWGSFLNPFGSYNKGYIRARDTGQKVEIGGMVAPEFIHGLVIQFVSANPSSTEQASIDAKPSPMYPEALHPAATGDAYYDHAIDGVYVGNLVVSVKPTSTSFYSMDLPFILSINVDAGGKAYASVTFMDTLETLDKEKHVWQTAYTGDIAIKSVGSSQATTTYDVSISFDPQIADNIIPLTKAGKKIKLTLKGHFDDTTSTQGGFTFDAPTKTRGYDPNFSVLPYLHRVTETKGLQGIWISGYRDSFFVRNDDDSTTDVGDLYIPTTLTVWQTTAEPTPDMQNWCSQLFVGSYFGHQKIQGDSIYLSSQETLENCYVLDLKKSKKEQLSGTFEYYEALGIRQGSGVTLTFERAGFGGKKVKVKRVKPAVAGFANAAKEISLTIKGKGFAPGAMPHFSHPDLELKSVTYTNSKTLKVKVAPRKAIENGTKIGIRVVNPDNISGSKNGVLTAK
jgi:hypothetical protein